MNYNSADVRRVAEAIGNGLCIDENGKNAYKLCRYCNARTYHDWNDEKEDSVFEHELDCVVLVARDLLT